MTVSVPTKDSGTKAITGREEIYRAIKGFNEKCFWLSNNTHFVARMGLQNLLGGKHGEIATRALLDGDFAPWSGTHKHTVIWCAKIKQKLPECKSLQNPTIRKL